MSSEIIDRGRGPEIAGTRITVFDILDYQRLGWHHTLIAATLRISSDQVLAALRYIEEHAEEVEAVYRTILRAFRPGQLARDPGQTESFPREIARDAEIPAPG